MLYRNMYTSTCIHLGYLDNIYIYISIYLSTCGYMYAYRFSLSLSLSLSLSHTHTHLYKKPSLVTDDRSWCCSISMIAS